jgi:hypothetical protein
MAPVRRDDRRFARAARDRGLDRVRQATTWTAAGALALTGGFAALAAHGFTGHAGATTSVRPTTSPATGPVSPAPATTAPTRPSAGGDDEGGDDGGPAATTPQTAPQTVTPDTQSPWVAPVAPDPQQWQPPVSQSGGS